MRDLIIDAGGYDWARAAVRGWNRAVAVLCWATLLLLASRAPAPAIVCTNRPYPTFYVRSCGQSDPTQCNDNNDGTTPQTAWATLTRAVDHLNFIGTQNPFTLVIVGPGTYAEGDVALKPAASGLPGFPNTLRADPTGTCTGDPPGPVTIDVKGLYCSLPNSPPALCESGFLVFGASNVLIDGFHVTNANLAGIEVRPGPSGEESIGAIVANNVLYDNGDQAHGLGRGVQVVDSTGTVVFNNLIYNNVTTGIGVLGSPNARVVNNTLYGNGGSGIVIAHDEPPPGASPPPPTRNSPGAWLINNIIDDIVVPQDAFAIDVDGNAQCDYIGAFNLLAGSTVRSPTTPRDPSDIVGVDPQFVDPTNANFTVGAGSPAIDGGPVSASVLGLNDSSITGDGVPDGGAVDLGYHAGHTGSPILKNPPLTTNLLYVRASGNDLNDGSTPEQAFATIGTALNWARAQTRVIVGPGTYAENVQLNGLVPAGPLELFADATGQLTGDAPDAVLVDAGRHGDGLNDVGRCSLIIDGVSVTNAGDPHNADTGNGIYLKNASGSILRNTITFSNAGVGINVENSDNVQVFNNLAYANGSTARLRGGGIQVGGDAGSKKAVVQNNTCYGNGVNGIQIGTATGPSTDAAVLYNIAAYNGQNGIQLGSDTTYDVDIPGYTGGYNLVYGETYGFGAGTPRQLSDLDGYDPYFVNPNGPDGVLGGANFADDDFRLSQVAAGQPMQSPAVDPPGGESAVMAGLADRTTRTDLAPDMDGVDIGFHYPAAVVYTTPTPSPTEPLVGDCNGDGRVTIDELVVAVDIALNTAPMSMCPAVDTNRDGQAEVNELVAAVNSALGG